VRTRDVDSDQVVSVARTALKRAAEALRALGETLPPWTPERTAERRDAPLLKEYAEHLRAHRGNAPKTITNHLWQLDHLLKFLRRRRRALRDVRLRDIDALIVQRRQQCSVRTVVDLCNVVRSFLRFLHVSGRLKVDIAPSVRAPVRKTERPPRALPWRDLQRILRGIERTSSLGRRDYAMLLTMSAYGCGAGEVIRLKIKDIDWQGEKLRLVRPKTSTEILLPLLPGVARALADYLRRGRPVRASTPAVFVRARPPYAPLSSSSAVSHALQRHARRAGVSADYLGSHALRHTHACRQMELGTQAKLIGDILGHRDPESTSAYLRVSIERLRRLALPVPR
jgi:site-specific recombinase XerD